MQAGWLGKGKEKEDEPTHVSQPLSSLRDPASFGPPPKRTGTSTSRTTSNQTSSTPSFEQRQHDQSSRRQPVEPEPEEEEPPPPPLPFRADRTGLSTSNLPPPPVRRSNATADVEPVSARPKPSAPPRLPPRLPPRTSTAPSPHSPSTPPAYSAPSPSAAYSEGYVNEEAASRLSSAGVSVPALGIGDGSETHAKDDIQRAGSKSQAPVDELQARFARMRTGSRTPVSDYSSVETASSTGRPPPAPVSRVDTSQSTSQSNGDGDGLHRKKAPPPPPPKKASIRAPPVNNNEPAAGPPPIPHATRPR